MPAATAVLFFFEVAGARDASIHTVGIVADCRNVFDRTWPVKSPGVC